MYKLYKIWGWSSHIKENKNVVHLVFVVSSHIVLSDMNG